MMKTEDQIKERLDRLNKSKKWAERIKKLANRRKNPMTELEFCEKYGFHPASFNRSKNCVSFPTARTVQRIETALKKEGV